MNTKKLAKINNGRTMEKRVALSQVHALVSTARSRGNSVALMATIHAEINEAKRAPQNKFERMDTWTPATDYERNTAA